MDRYYSFTRFRWDQQSPITRVSPPSPKLAALLSGKATAPLSRLFWSVAGPLLISLFFFCSLPFYPLLLKLTMAALLLFAILFTCGIMINSYLFLHQYPKLMAWLGSFLYMASSAPKPIMKTPKKDGKEVIVSEVPADKEAGIETVFATFDRDGDGFITAEELEESFKRLGLFSTRNEIVSMMERVDANGDGLIDLEEFGELYDSLGRGRGGGGGGDGDNYCRVERGKEEDQELEGEMELREAFDVFDENGDGLITVEELGLVLASLGLKRGATAEDCRHMIGKVDLDGDGMVNFGEFKKMMVEGGKLF